MNSIVVIHRHDQAHAESSVQSEMMTIAGPANSAEPAARKGSQ